MENKINLPKLTSLARGLSSDDLRKAFADYVVDVVCNHFPGCTRENVVNLKSNSRTYVYARFATYDILYNRLPKIAGSSVHYSYKYISDYFNKSNHSSVIHGLIVHQQLMDVNDKVYAPKYRAVYDEISCAFMDGVSIESIESRIKFIDKVIAELSEVKEKLQSNVSKTKIISNDEFVKRKNA
jgi:hypothetical protein